MIARSFKNITAEHAEDAENFLTYNALNFVFFIELLTISDCKMLFKITQQDPVTNSIRQPAQQLQYPYAFPNQIAAARPFNDQHMRNKACYSRWLYALRILGYPVERLY
jgi:hypothetical protein